MSVEWATIEIQDPDETLPGIPVMTMRGLGKWSEVVRVPLVPDVESAMKFVAPILSEIIRTKMAADAREAAEQRERESIPNPANQQKDAGTPPESEDPTKQLEDVAIDTARSAGPAEIPW